MVSQLTRSERKVKIIFHPEFHRSYTADPAAEAGRLEPVENALREHFPFIEPRPVPLERIRSVHSESHIASVKGNEEVFNMALLAAGGALEAATLGALGEAAMAIIRPPGHHASADSCWGFCYFNNVAVAVETLLKDPSVPVDSALILDIDLHFGDGTANIFRNRSNVTYAHPEGTTPEEWLDDCRQELDQADDVDIIAVSAGFDRHAEDWGQLLRTEDYYKTGQLVRELAEKRCQGKRFALLEGGYNPSSMAEAAEALARGLADEDDD